MEYIIEKNAEVVIPEKKGKDSVYFKDVTNFEDLIFTKNERDLIIKSDDAQATITNYFSTNGLTTTSSVKTLRIENESIDLLKSGLIESGLTLRPDKKGKISGSKFTDNIIGTENNDRIYSNGGNDNIFSSLGNDSIYLSSGNENIIYTSNFGIDKIYNLGKNDYIEFTNITKENISAYKEGNNLVLGTNETNKVTFVNYFKSLNKNNVQTNFQFKDGNIDFSNGEKEVISLFYSARKGQTIKGSVFNDSIIGSNYSDKIYSNGGYDVIDGGKGNDKIYAKSENCIIYSEGNFGKDTIYNTKGSINLIFDSSINTSPDFDNLLFTRKNNNLIINSTNANNYGTLTIKDYFKSEKDITIGKHKDEKTLISLLKNVENITYFDYSTSKKGKTIKGSWLTDKIYGSDKNDKIYGYGNTTGTTKEFIDANKGNDKIYTGSGKFELKFNQGDGKDTIWLTNDEKSTYHFDFGMEEKYYEPLIDKEIVKERHFAEIKFIRTGKSNDLKIVYSYDGGKTTDMITIKNFYKMPEIADKIYINNYITVNPTNNNKLSTIMTMGAIETYITGNGKLYGTDYGDFLTGGKRKDTIYANSWTDYVYAKENNDKIFLANSLDVGISSNIKGLYFNTGDGTDTIDTSNLEFGAIGLYSKSTNLYQTTTGNVIAGNFGGYTQNEINTFYWNDIFNKTVTFGETYDITNSKMIFQNFLNEEADILILNLGTNKIHTKEEIINNMGYYEELSSNKIYNKNNPLIYEGSENSDYTIAGKKYNIITSNDGDDVIVTSSTKSSKTNIDGGAGKDSVVIKNITAGTTIKNAETIQINNIKADKLRFIFNVEKNSENLYKKDDYITIYSNKNISKGQNGLKWVYGNNDNKYFNSGIYVENNGLDANIIIANKKGLNANNFDTQTLLRVVGSNVQNYFNKNSEYFGENGININSYYDLLSFDTSKLTKAELKVLNKHKKALYNIYKTALSKNDTITSSTIDNFKRLEGQKGNDTYIVKEDDFKNDKIIINDTAGKKDTINIENINKEDTSLFFDVTLKTNKKGKVIYKKGNATYTNTGNLSILSNIDYTKNIEDMNGLTIENYFKKGKIENILSNGIKYDTTSIKTLSTKIANWLAENNYTSTNDVLNNGTVSAKTNLLLMYQDKENIIKRGSELEINLNDDDIIIAKEGFNAYFTPELSEEDNSIPNENGNAGGINPDTPTFPTTPDLNDNTLRINGYKGNDLIIADDINRKIVINSGIGNDTIYSGKGENIIYGDLGDDYIILNANGDSSISAGSGDDTIIVEDVGITTYINGDNGNDIIDGRKAKYYSLLIGGNGNDIIHSSTNVESSCEIQGGAGNDTIYTYSDTDSNIDSVDNIEGMQKINIVRAGSGNDEIHTSKGQNNIYIESTTDVTNAANDSDIYYYGGGEDYLYFENTDFSEWIFEQKNNDLIIHHANENKFTIKDYFTFDDPHIYISDKTDEDIEIEFWDIRSFLNVNYTGVTVYGTAENDTINVNGSNNYRYNLYGYDGDDKITSTGGVCIMNGGNGNDIYEAKSEYNQIWEIDINSNPYTIFDSNDTINAYIDKSTSIYDYMGTNDELNIINSANNNATHDNINIVFNISNTYTTAQGITFGNTLILDDTNTSNWAKNTNYKGIGIAGNQIETINASDGYYVTSTQIAQLAEDVASWLTTKGYETVSEVITAEKTVGDIDALLAKFDTIEWQQTT